MAANRSGHTVLDGPKINSECPWDEFDPVSYHLHNYGVLRDEDREILVQVRDFFAGVRDVYDADGLDVGTGPNLYPSLTLLPLCKRITLWEYSSTNVKWLHDQVRRYSDSWDAFWEVLKQKPSYRKVGDPRAALGARATVRRGSIFDLPSENWDIGTMFFVAESITSAKLEFDRAIKSFLGALRSRSPFAIALMENSEGYQVGDINFPAIKVDVDTVHRKLRPHAPDVEVKHIDSDGLRREGYSGMILAYGRLKK